MNSISIKDAIEIALTQGGSREEMCCKKCKNIVVEPPNKLCNDCKKEDLK